MRRGVVASMAAYVLTIGAQASGQIPTLAVPSLVTAPGAVVPVTVSGIPGRFYAVVGSTTGAGVSFAGVPLAVGPDAVLLAQGTIGVSGSVTVAVTPPFVGTVLDRFYLQAVTSALPSFVPPEPSAGVVLRNADLVGGVTALATLTSGAWDLGNVNGLVSAGNAGGGGVMPSGAGTRMVWNPRKSAFRVGTVFDDAWDDANVGLYSMSMGYSTRATAVGSTAIGYGAQAFADGASAFGFQVAASGIGSLALGYGSSASGLYAVAMGNQASASGLAAVAIGDFTTASGAKSTSVGSNATTAGFSGAFVYGDSVFTPGGGPVSASAANQVTFRASGGVRFFSNAAMTTGVELPAGGGAFSNLSDAHQKEHFRDLDGEDVLARLARVPVREWSYKTQGHAVRHVGPTAQDFHAAFGLGENPLRISTLDPDGIALKGIQALDARTVALASENAALRADIDALRAALAALTALKGPR